MSQQFDHVQYGSREIVYAIERTSRRKTIGITIKPNCTVVVVAPKGTRRTRIARVVQSKAGWVLKQQDAVARIQKRPAKELVSGETLWYLGRQQTLKICRASSGGDTKRVRLIRGQLRVEVPEGVSQARVNEWSRQEISLWYRHHARHTISGIAKQYALKLGVSYESLQYRGMKTRWGSGGPDGRLRFNWRIVMAPKRLIEYVVAHELCHIRHHRHSPAFWRLLGKVMPNYEQRRQELMMLGSQYDV